MRVGGVHPGSLAIYRLRGHVRGNRPTFDPGTLFSEALREPQYALTAHAEGAA